jgi:hypothetical protein
MLALLPLALGSGCGSSAGSKDALCLRDDYYEQYLPSATPQGITPSGQPVAQPPSPINDLRVALLKALPCSFTDLDERVAGAPVVSVSPLTSTEREAVAKIATTFPQLHVTVVAARQSLAVAEAQEGEISNALHNFRFAFSATSVDHDGQVVVDIGGVPYVDQEAMRRAIVGAAITTEGAHSAPRVTITVERRVEPIGNGEP